MNTNKQQRKLLVSELLSGLAVVDSSKDVHVNGVSEYSGDVEMGDLFIATSELQYVQEAIANGAVAIIYESSSQAATTNIDSVVPMFECDDLSTHVYEIIQRFYDQDENSIRTIAITGTDGKSSVAHLIAQALESSQESCGLIGTLGYGRLDNLVEATHTTPPASRIAKEYYKFNQIGCTAVAIEASSHGIAQKRLQNLSIHTAVLTNITRDHLDYHNSLEEYIKAKAGLFFTHQPKNAVINIDDATGSQWVQQLSSLLDVITFSLADVKADVYACDVQYEADSTLVKLSINQQEININVPLLGRFNVLNILAVAAVLVSMGKNIVQIEEALNSLQAVPGRMQAIVADNAATTIVDYAHTPAALFAALNAVREHCVGKLICVFGCGGDRDQGKRSQMGEIATRYADFTVITSDNPRNEEPQVIVDQIVEGCIEQGNYKIIIDREDAIISALTMANKNDAVLIAGKGHEKYQIVGSEKIIFDDVDVAARALARRVHG